MKYIALALVALALLATPAQAWYGHRWQTRTTQQGTYVRYEWRTPYSYYWVVRFYPNYRR